MKPIPVQLITVRLDNGRQGIFIGTPLVSEQCQDHEAEVEDIWFSNIQALSPQMDLAELLNLIHAQLCRCESATH